MIFENQSDLIREDYAINKFIEHMSKDWHRFKDCTCVKLGRFDLDYIIQFNNGKKITVEIKGVKQHKIDSNHIPVVSVAKVEKMQKSVNCDGFNASFIIFAYIDGLKYQELRNLTGRFSWGGRQVRKGSANDKEIILIFDSTEFKKVHF